MRIENNLNIDILFVNHKLLANNSDLYVSHDTWGPYEVMLKMMKHFKLNFHLNQLGFYLD